MARFASTGAFGCFSLNTTVIGSVASIDARMFGISMSLK